jgi:DNA repair exonuclease SbcCD ATPase subunit
MAKANFVKKAQKDIFVNGKRVEYVSEKGKRKGQTLSKIDKTIPRDENDNILIAKGESYYWWQFQNSPKQYSKNPPRASQLTQSAYLSTLYGIDEQIEDFSADTAEELKDFVEDIKTQLEELRDTTQESFDNIPENLQYSPNAELLQERIECLESAIDELDSMDLEYEEKDEEELQELVAEDKGIDTEEENWKDEITTEEIDDKRQELESEWVEEKMGDITCITLE